MSFSSPFVLQLMAETWPRPEAFSNGPDLTPWHSSRVPIRVGSLASLLTPPVHQSFGLLPSSCINTFLGNISFCHPHQMPARYFLSEDSFLIFTYVFHPFIWSIWSCLGFPLPLRHTIVLWNKWYRTGSVIEWFLVAASPTYAVDLTVHPPWRMVYYPAVQCLHISRNQRLQKWLNSHLPVLIVFLKIFFNFSFPQYLSLIHI